MKNFKNNFQSLSYIKVLHSTIGIAANLDPTIAISFCTYNCALAIFLKAEENFANHCGSVYLTSASLGVSFHWLLVLKNKLDKITLYLKTIF